MASASQRPGDLPGARVKVKESAYTTAKMVEKILHIVIHTGGER